MVNAVHGRYQGDGDESDDDAHEDDDGRLEEAGEPLDLHVELPVVEGGGRGELCIEGARLLADTEHLSRCPREETGAAQWLSEPLTLHHLLTHHGQTSAVDRVVR